ncbi:MAG: hypothetical protein HUU46_05820 [Candidatus Hydrogenedentes bacterium]|nr:hypothetical protein [Candidatus Hydrogenedentota bacterium]
MPYRITEKLQGVKVSAGTLANAVSTIQGAKGGVPVFSFAKGEFELRRLDVAVTIPATGAWPGPVQVRVAQLPRLKKYLDLKSLDAEIDILPTLRALRIGEIQVPCTWRARAYEILRGATVITSPEHRRKFEEVDKIIGSKYAAQAMKDAVNPKEDEEWRETLF